MERFEQMDSRAVKKVFTVATATSLLVSNSTQAIEAVDTTSDSSPTIEPGSLAGIFSVTANIHNDILSEPPAITAEQIEAEATIEAVDEALSVETPTQSESVTDEAKPEANAETEELKSEVEAENEESIENDSESEIDEYADSRDYSEAGGLLMADVRTALNIRTAPSMSGEIIGQMRPTDTAEIVSHVDGWYEIVSGKVSGYVSEKYSMTGPDAAERQSVLSDAFVTCNVRKLHVRSEATTESEIIEDVKYNDTIIIDDTAEPVDGWVSIVTDDYTGYVSEEYVDVYDGVLGTAITADEIEEDRLRRQEEMRRYNQAISVGADEQTLLAALLICEAGASYEGMLAVGGVVMNRLHAGYASDIPGVIYQSGQFSPVSNGRLSSVLSSGVNESALRAANEALAGVDITGGCLNFRAAFTGHSGTNIGGNVFF